MRNKYNACRTRSELCEGRVFDSKAEARRGEELRLLEMAGEIKDLQYQVPFVLSVKPSVKIVLDFVYMQPFPPPCRGMKIVYEDVKGMVTATARVKLAWLKEKYGIEVALIR